VLGPGADHAAHAAVGPIGAQVDAGLAALGLTLRAGGHADALAAVLAGGAALLAGAAVLGVGAQVCTAALAHGHAGGADRLALAVVAGLAGPAGRHALEGAVRTDV